jgi:pimeloyl-ACP methyl ester carboxylesterase
MSIEPPAPLVEALRKGKCALFVGSGFSVSAGLPTWDKLIGELIELLKREVPADPVLPELDDLRKNSKYLDIAQHAAEALSRDAFTSFLRQQIRRVDARPGEIHRLAARLPFAFFVTTNYDQLLEQALPDVTVATQADTQLLSNLLYDGGRFLLKAHGDIDRSDTIILTATDYQKAIHLQPSFGQIFSSLKLHYSILFVGYSLSDPDFNLLLERHVALFGHGGAKRYALLWKGEISVIESRTLERTQNITVIRYDDHAQVGEFLRALEQSLSHQPAQSTTEPPPDPLQLTLRPRLGARTQIATEPAEIVERFQSGTADEQEELLLRSDDSVRQALVDFLGQVRFEELRRLARKRATSQGREAQQSDRALRGRVVFIPGMFGSELSLFKEDRHAKLIWLRAWSLLSGGYGQLRVRGDGSSEHPIRPSGIIKRFYGELLDELDRVWNAEVFFSDWRLDLLSEAARLREFILRRVGADTPCHIVAHGSGGLLARALILEHPDIWEGMLPVGGKPSNVGGRLVMLGTPHHGWFASLQMLTAREPALRHLALVDLRHNLRQIQEVVSTFPALYQMLPSPLRNPVWEAFYLPETYGDLPVAGKWLERGLEFHKRLEPVADPDRMVCVLGNGVSTVTDVENPSRIAGSVGEFFVTDRGDGRTTHALGTLESGGEELLHYFVDSNHGELVSNRHVLAAVREILYTGKTWGLASAPGAAVEVIPPEVKLAR